LGKIMKAIAAILASLPKQVWNVTKKTWEWGKDAAVAAVDVVEHVVTLPFRAMGEALGGCGPQPGEPGPQQAAQEAANRAIEAERRADDQAELRTKVNAFRRAGSARARGLPLTATVLEGCPDGFRRYLSLITREEAQLIARAPTRELRAMVLNSDNTPKGVRTFAEVSNANSLQRQAADPAAAKQRKVAELRQKMLENLRAGAPTEMYAMR
jgi:hypothetical protein